jgi:hypothetical protein
MERTPITLLTLPADPLRLIAEILFRSTGRDLVNLCLTNSRFNRFLCGSPDFWRFLYYRDISEFPPKDGPFSFKKVYLDFYRIQEYYRKLNQAAVEWNRKWFTILESRTAAREQLEELGFNEISIRAFLKLPPCSIEEWEKQDREDYG